MENKLGFVEKHSIKIDFAKPFEAYRNEAIKNLDSYTLGQMWNGVELRGRQETVFDDLRNFVKKGGLEGYVALPTAAGKTPLYIKFMEAIIGNTDIKVIIAVPTNTLVDQTEKMLYKFLDKEKIETLPDKIGVLNYLHKDYNAPILITTYKSWQMNTESGTINPNEYQLLILDEAHEVLSERRTETLGKFTGAFKLGLTATPEYSEEKKLMNVLPNEIHRMSIREAVYEGLLSGFSVYAAETTTDLTNVKISTATGDFDEKDLDIAINTDTRNHAVIDVYQNLFPDLPSAIANCGSISQAEKLAEMANKSGIPALAVSSNMKELEIREAVWNFKSGNIKLITNVDMLTRGFDAPNAIVCLNAVPTLSKVRATQRPGRVLRLDPEEYERGYSSKRAYIVDFVDKTENRKAIPISFAEIAEDAEIERSQTRHYSGKPTKSYRIEKPDFSIEGINVITEPRLVMNIVKEMKNQRLTNPPENYVSKVDLIRKFGITYGEFGELISQLGEELVKHPEWIGEYISKSGRQMLFYHPDFINLISLNRDKYIIKLAPEGWENQRQIAKSVGKEGNSIKPVIKNLSEDLKKHPEWKGDYKNNSGQVVTFYHPNFVKLIKINLAKNKEATKGWSNMGQIMKDSGRAGTTVKLVLKRLSDELKKHPEWQERSKQSTGKTTVFYHPDFVNLILEKLQKKASAPQGWRNMRQISEEAGVDGNTIKSWIEKLKNRLEKYPEWRGEYGDAMGRIKTFYHPDFVKLLKDKIGFIKLKPVGWMSKTQIAKSFGTYRENIEPIMESLSEELKKHPQWKGEYRGRSGRVRTFYHPDFVEIIKKEYEIRDNKRI